MTLKSPTLQLAYDKFMARKPCRGHYEVFGQPGTYTGRHSALKLAYVPIRLTDPLYMTWRYCEGCKQGYPLDVVREVPHGAETPAGQAAGTRSGRTSSGISAAMRPSSTRPGFHVQASLSRSKLDDAGPQLDNIVDVSTRV